MTTYEQLNFAQIADAVGMDVARITEHQNLFKAAALGYRLDKKRPERVRLRSRRTVIGQR
jgi:hypothetical protein